MHSQFESEPVRAPAHPLLEQYLDQLCAPLQAGLPAQEYEATRQEMRAHLLLSAAAREELGTASDEALTEAFQQFGDPQLLGRQLAQENNLLRSKRALSAGVRILGGLTGGWAALYLAPFFPCLINMDARMGEVSPPYFLQVLLFLLGGRAGWLLAAGKGASAAAPLAGLAGSLVGMGTGAMLMLFAYHRGWLSVTYPVGSGDLCIYAALGAAMGWRLWKRPKSLPGSILLGSTVFALPVLLVVLTLLCRYPDYRSVHSLSLHSVVIPIIGLTGGITGGAMGFLARGKRLWEAATGHPSILRTMAFLRAK